MASNGYNALTTMAPQARWRRILLLTVVPVVFIFLYYAHSPSVIVPGEVFVPSVPSESQPHAQSSSSSPAHPPPSTSNSEPAHLHSASPPPAAPKEEEKENEKELEKDKGEDNTKGEEEDTKKHVEEQIQKAKAPEPEKALDMSMATIIKALYGPMLHPIDAANFTDEDGGIHRLGGEPRFKEKLGKKVLILDVDSRPLTGEGQLMNEELKWKSMRPLSAGMLSHYMFALIHGYDYKFIRAPDYADRWGTWVKVPMMREALKTHDYIVFMDSDVMFHYPHLPLEWLMNYWNMTKETLVMMSIDPDEPQNYDDRGNRFLNTGFVIAQQSERTQDMFKAWAECPSETRYKGCARWKLDWAHEQAAFGNYLRYDFDRPEDIKVLPCVEANGAPEAVNRGGCRGVFVRHFWVDKGLLSKGLADTVMQYMVPRLHDMYLETAEEHIMDAKGFKLEGAELIELTQEEKDELRDGGGKNQKDEGF